MTPKAPRQPAAPIRLGLPRRDTTRHGPACSLRSARRGPARRRLAPDVGRVAPPLYVVTRPGVLAALRAPGARPTPAAPDVGAPTAAPRRSVGGALRIVRVTAIVALVRTCSFLRLATELRETRTSCENVVRNVYSSYPRRTTRRAACGWAPTLFASAQLVARDLAAVIAAIAAACRQADLRSRTKEPRSLPSAAGEVELPPLAAEAARPQGQRELQRDAEGPTTTSGTHQATSTKMLNARGSDPRSPAEGGLRGDGPTSARAHTQGFRQKVTLLVSRARTVMARASLFEPRSVTV